MPPTYNLAMVKRLTKEGKFVVTLRASMTAFGIGFDDADIVDCISNHVTFNHFYKTMPAAKRPGFMQDVYRVEYSGKRIYLKVQVDSEGRTVVVSFKADTSKP